MKVHDNLDWDTSSGHCFVILIGRHIVWSRNILPQAKQNILRNYLKVVGNEKEGGSRRWQMMGIGLRPRRSRFVCLTNFAVGFDFMYFRFRPSKAKWIGNVLTNRRNAARRSMFFFSFILRIAYWRTESVGVIRQSGVNRKKAREKLTGNYRRYNIFAPCLMAQGSSLRQYIGAGNDVPSLILRLLQKKKRCKCSPRFA